MIFLALPALPTTMPSQADLITRQLADQARRDISMNLRLRNALGTFQKIEVATLVGLADVL
jgi:hypothetical protein